MNHLIRGLSLGITLVTAAVTPSVAAVIADLGVDFSSAANPNGNWSYAAASSVGGILTLLDASGTIGAGPDFAYRIPGGSDGSPVVGANLLGTSSIIVFGSSVATFAPYEAWMHPGSDGRYAVARLTVPTTITGTFSVLFEGVDSVGTSSDVHVQINAVTMFSDSIVGTGDAGSYSLSGTFTAGDLIDLYVGTNGNGYAFDSTGVIATLTDAPEPATLGILGLGVAALAGFRRARR